VSRTCIVGACWMVVYCLFLASCSTYEPFDTDAHLQQQSWARVPEDLRDRVEIPYELDPETLEEVDRVLSPAGSEKRRTDEIVAFIFSGLGLEYALTPTKNASETFATRSGNCLSFVNLFVGIARHQRLNPFYVEVEDYQRWNFDDGVVISRGHIVAGMNVDGELSTFDFLPYRPKGYRDFDPIDDITAMSHFYNNLGAEALMEGEIEAARDYLRIAYALAPDFEKAINNLGVVYLRTSEPEKALEIFESGLRLHPTSVPLLSNQARALQELGDLDRATEIFDQIEQVNQSNPYFYIYRGELALSRGNVEGALEYMRRALRADSEVPEVHLGLVKVFVAIGDLQRARHHLERALKLDATNEEARKYAAMLQGPPSGAGGD
jgi:Flp pilus assembly protein TadD